MNSPGNWLSPGTNCFIVGLFFGLENCDTKKVSMISVASLGKHTLLGEPRVFWGFYCNLFDELLANSNSQIILDWSVVSFDKTFGVFFPQRFSFHLHDYQIVCGFVLKTK